MLIGAGFGDGAISADVHKCGFRDDERYRRPLLPPMQHQGKPRRGSAGDAICHEGLRLAVLRPVGHVVIDGHAPPYGQADVTASPLQILPRGRFPALRLHDSRGRRP